MSGLSGHLVRRGAQMAQVHFTKVIAEPVPAHDSAPTMDIDPAKMFPVAAVAIVTVILIASVCSQSEKRDDASLYTNNLHRSATRSARSSHPWP